MSRIAKEPVNIPKDIEFNMSGLTLTLKGAKGSLSMDLNPEVSVEENDSILSFSPKSGSKFALAISGTTRALVANMVHGVSQGFEKNLNSLVLVIVLRLKVKN